MTDVDPMGLSNEARTDATKRLGELQRTIRDEIVTRPAVSDKVSRDMERAGYLGVRNNETEIGALVQNYGLKRTIAMLKEQERKLGRDKKGGRYDDAT